MDHVCALNFWTRVLAAPTSVACIRRDGRHAHPRVVYDGRARNHLKVDVAEQKRAVLRTMALREC